jgi:hypothetical protein
VESQQEKMGIKMFFRQGEMAALLKSCIAGLQQALDVFMASLSSILTYLLTNGILAGEWC